MHTLRLHDKMSGDDSPGVVVLKLEREPESPGSLLRKCKFPGLTFLQIQEVREIHIFANILGYSEAGDSPTPL